MCYVYNSFYFSAVTSFAVFARISARRLWSHSLNRNTAEQMSKRDKWLQSSCAFDSIQTSWIRWTLERNAVNKENTVLLKLFKPLPLSNRKTKSLRLWIREVKELTCAHDVICALVRLYYVYSEGNRCLLYDLISADAWLEPLADIITFTGILPHSLISLNISMM